MRHEKLFVYGTLMFLRFRKTAFGKAVTGMRAMAMRPNAPTREPYGALIPQRGAVVHGLVFTLTEQELKKCDKYEARYERRRVRLNTGDTAWTYAMRMY